MFDEFVGCGESDDLESILRELAKRILDGQGRITALQNVTIGHTGPARAAVREGILRRHVEGMIDHHEVLSLFESIGFSAEDFPSQLVKNKEYQHQNQ